MSTLRSELRTYAPALALDALLSRTARRILLVILALVESGLFLLLLWSVADASLGQGALNTAILVTDNAPLTGVFLILLGPLGVLLQLSFFYNTLYFRGLDAIVHEDFNDAQGITIEVAEICAHIDGDLTKGFLDSAYGQDVLFRLGVEQLAVDTFLDAPRTPLSLESVSIPVGTFLTPHDVGVHIFDADPAFASFLFAQGITKELFAGACMWMVRSRIAHKHALRWWGRDTLGRVRGIGRELSYGVAYELRRYTRDINTTSAFSLFINDAPYANEIIAKMETTLVRSKSANVLLVGEPGVGKMDMLIELGRRMREGRSVASLEAKRLVVFDTDAFIASHNSKEAFESTFLTLMAETERAGNIILVIEQFTAFIQSVSALGVNVADLVDRFLNSPHIHIVATVDPGGYHQSLETNGQLLQFFNPIIIDTPDMSNTVQVLEDAVGLHERAHHVFFTYPALVRIVESANRYIVEGVMPDKALSLMAEVASGAAQAGVRIVLASVVDDAVRTKTGIPTGAVSDTERDLLVHLEDVLHERVIGQQSAVRAIASAMRRARAGIQSAERPISSFLFLGSTGVGKTETAKALAHTFFGAESNMLRFDMSEFSDNDGLARLIGTSTQPGALASALREHPYSVVLFDEFEKSSESVHDLFLQILDEGMFTDARGTQVNARNCIIIATSNAGGDIIFDYVQRGEQPDAHKDDIIKSIIDRATFKPELINRFDAVILFESLDADAQRQIARLMLEELQQRIHERGYTLVIDDMLIDVLMTKGFDPEFGARPMRRAIQDMLEERIATKILAENLPKGARIEFTPEDFAGAV